MRRGSGAYVLGRNKRGSSNQIEESKAFITLARSGWGNEHSPFIRSFFSFWMPSASPEELNAFIRSQNISHSAEIAVMLRGAVDEIDITELLPRVRAPTIVFHCVRDTLVPLDQGRRVAASIPNATFVALDSDNHALLAGEPAWKNFVEGVESFLGPNEPPRAKGHSGSKRTPS
jgi:pimeloyl-ACP methyl ester carboxylesterase